MSDTSTAKVRSLSTTNPTNPSHRGDRFRRLPGVMQCVPYSRASIYRLIAAGQFPRPYSLGARAVAWLESEIDAWIEARVKAGQAVQK
jgi:prophage regulatory protein